MVQVPDYRPVPTIEPTEQGAPLEHIETPPAAFGATVAGAEQKLGSDLSETGNELFNRAIAMQQLTLQSDVMNRAAKFYQDQGQLHAQYSATQGIDAVNGYQPYSVASEKLRQAGLEGLPPVARIMYDQETRQFLARNLFSAAGHAATEQKSYTVGAAKGQVDLSIINAGNSWNDPSGFNDALNKIHSQYQFLQAAHGWSDVETQANESDAVAKAQLKRLDSMSITEPFQARELLKTQPGIFGNYRAQAEAIVERQVAGIGSREIVDGLANGSYLDRLSQAESGNRLFVRSTTSNAQGLYQFTPSTWSAVRAAHPDLNLPASVGAANSDQQTAAAKAFTADNQAILTKAGIDTGMQNTYLAHFLGAQGAVKFIQGMKEDGSQPGLNLVSPQAAAANRSIFYNPDGSPRSASSVYIRLTAPFAGPGPLDANSPASWLSAAETAGAAVAKEIAPENPSLQDMVLQRLRTRYDVVHNGAIQAQQGNYQTLAQEIGGPGLPHSLTDIDQIMSNPVAANIYNSLDQSYKTRLLSQLAANAKFSPNATPERDQNFQRLMAASIDINGKVPEFMKIDPYALVNDGLITRPQADKMYEAQRKIMQRQSNDARNLSHILGATRDYMQSMNFKAGSDDELQWRAELNEWAKEFEATNQRPPTDEESRKKAAGMAATVGASHILGMSFGGRYGYEPPQEFITDATALFKKYSGGRDPTAEDLGRMYEHSLTHPNWRTE